MQIRRFIHRKEERVIIRCGMEEHKQGCGNGQFLLTLPSCMGTALIYEEMAEALCPGFPISLQNCAGLGYRCRILCVGSGPLTVFPTGSHSVTGTTVGDQIHFKNKFFGCLLELIFERWSTWCLLPSSG